MSDSGRIKLFLISAMNYSVKANNASYIDSMLAFAGDASESSLGAKKLDSSSVFYQESSCLADVFALSSVSSVDNARCFSMSLLHGSPPIEFNGYVIGDTGGEVVNVESSLFFDTHACFLLVTEVSIEVRPADCLDLVIASVISGRSIFNNLGIVEYMSEAFECAESQAIQSIELKRLGISYGDVFFDQENTLPLVICDRPIKVNSSWFQNEERLSSISDLDSLAKDYPGGFFYPGWNYTIAAGLPHEVFDNILQIMIRCQAFYFCLTHIKTYFSKELECTLAGRNEVDEKIVSDADRVRLAFYDLLAKFNSYKSKLFPKYHEEVVRLMRRWHCDDDVKDIKDYIELNFQAKDRIHKSHLEKQNEKQSKALAFIAILQILAVFSVFADGASLAVGSPELFILSTFLCFLVFSAFSIIDGFSIRRVMALSLLALCVFGAIFLKLLTG